MMEDNKRELNQVDEINEVKPDSPTEVVENTTEVADAKEVEVYDGVNKEAGGFGAFLRLMALFAVLIGFVWCTFEFIAPSEKRVEVYTKIEEATGFTVPTLNKVTVSDKQAMAEAEEDAAEQAADQAKIDDYYAELDSYVDPMLEQVIESGMSEYEQVEAVYEWICQSITYDWEAYESGVIGDSGTALGAIKNETAVCGGFSELLDYCLYKLGIPCEILRSETHAWNKIYLDGQWVYADATWDAQQGGYTYFCKTEAEYAALGHPTAVDSYDPYQ